MDIDRCARVILSGAGRETGHLVDDPVRMAAAIVERDAVVPPLTHCRRLGEQRGHDHQRR